ncbi:hypothetical protein GE09DRAFT_1257766 [Coniochaeta sp. 2T2.1]|nr:hypothetical protein GE09DRAFT_1257766 [Coniochaeta sp. 2T2.1]
MSFELPAAYYPLYTINNGPDTAPTSTSTTSNKRKSPTHDDDHQPITTGPGSNKRMRHWREDAPHPGHHNRNYSSPYFGQPPPSFPAFTPSFTPPPFSPGTPSFTPVSPRYSPSGHDQHQYQSPPPAQPQQRTRTITVITIPDDSSGSWTNQWLIEEQREVPIEDERGREVIVISSDEEEAEDDYDGYDGDEEKDEDERYNGDDWEWEEEDRGVPVGPPVFYGDDGEGLLPHEVEDEEEKELLLLLLEEEEEEEGEIPEQEQEEEQDEWEREGPSGPRRSRRRCGPDAAVQGVAG